MKNLLQDSIQVNESTITGFMTYAQLIELIDNKTIEINPTIGVNLIIVKDYAKLIDKGESTPPYHITLGIIDDKVIVVDGTARLLIISELPKYTQKSDNIKAIVRFNNDKNEIQRFLNQIEK